MTDGPNDAWYALDALRRARKRVAKGWCRYVDARCAEGGPVNIDDLSARKWSAVGALRLAAYGAEDADPAKPRDFFARQRAYVMAILAFQEAADGPIVPYNNHSKRTQAQVVAAFDAAIRITAQRSSKEEEKG